MSMPFFTNRTSSWREDEYLRCFDEYSINISDGGCCSIWESTFADVWSAAKRKTASVGVMFTSSESSDYDDDENSIIFDEAENEEEEEESVAEYPESTPEYNRRALPSTRSAEDLEVLWLSSESYEEGDDMEIIEFTDSDKDRTDEKRQLSDTRIIDSNQWEESEYCKNITEGGSWLGALDNIDLSFIEDSDDFISNHLNLHSSTQSEANSKDDIHVQDNDDVFSIDFADRENEETDNLRDCRDEDVDDDNQLNNQTSKSSNRNHYEIDNLKVCFDGNAGNHMNKLTPALSGTHNDANDEKDDEKDCLDGNVFSNHITIQETTSCDKNSVCSDPPGQHVANRNRNKSDPPTCKTAKAQLISSPCNENDDPLVDERNTGLTSSASDFTLQNKTRITVVDQTNQRPIIQISETSSAKLTTAKQTPRRSESRMTPGGNNKQGRTVSNSKSSNKSSHQRKPGPTPESRNRSSSLRQPDGTPKHSNRSSHSRQSETGSTYLGRIISPRNQTKVQDKEQNQIPNPPWVRLDTLTEQPSSLEKQRASREEGVSFSFDVDIPFEEPRSPPLAPNKVDFARDFGNQIQASSASSTLAVDIPFQRSRNFVPTVQESIFHQDSSEVVGPTLEDKNKVCNSGANLNRDPADACALQDIQNSIHSRRQTEPQTTSKVANPTEGKRSAEARQPHPSSRQDEKDVFTGDTSHAVYPDDGESKFIQSVPTRTDRMKQSAEHSPEASKLHGSIHSRKSIESDIISVNESIGGHHSCSETRHSYDSLIVSDFTDSRSMRRVERMKLSKHARTAAKLHGSLHSGKSIASRSSENNNNSSQNRKVEDGNVNNGCSYDVFSVSSTEPSARTGYSSAVSLTEFPHHSNRTVSSEERSCIKRNKKQPKLPRTYSSNASYHSYHSYSSSSRRLSEQMKYIPKKDRQALPRAYV